MTFSWLPFFYHGQPHNSFFGPPFLTGVSLITLPLGLPFLTGVSLIILPLGLPFLTGVCRISYFLGLLYLVLVFVIIALKISFFLSVGQPRNVERAGAIK